MKAELSRQTNTSVLGRRRENRPQEAAQLRNPDLTARAAVPGPRTPEGGPAAAPGEELGLRSATNSSWPPAPSPHNDRDRCPARRRSPDELSHHCAVSG